jgi:tRNA dimethylallyltransferase
VDKYLLVVMGPTGVGKTDCCIQLANHFQTEVVSADARQCYRNMAIGTAQPSAVQQQQVKHHFIDCLSIEEPINAGMFEKTGLGLLQDLFTRHAYVVVTGGSGLYLQALCDGLDEMPPVLPTVRTDLQARLAVEGLAALVEELSIRDPAYYKVVDRNNPRRVLRALEVCIASQKPYSQVINRVYKPLDRSFRILKIGLCLDRAILYQRINHRVDEMIEKGLLSEARLLYPYKHYQALQTVGYQELFGFFEGKYGFGQAVELIKRNSRRYAKRQLTWFNKQADIKWFNADAFSTILDYIYSILGHEKMHSLGKGCIR